MSEQRETGWRMVVQADGWEDIDLARVRNQAVESIAWELLDQTMDLADREPGTAERLLGGRDDG